MSKWYNHRDHLFNLDKYTQIVRGNDEEILLVDKTFNGDWEDEDERDFAILTYDNEDQRDLAFLNILKLLEL